MQTEAQLREYFFWYAPLFRYCIAYARNIVSNEAWQGFAPNLTRQNGQVSRREQAARMGKPPAGRAVANAEDGSHQEVNYLHCDHINILGR